MKNTNKNLMFATILILVLAVFAPQIKDLTGKIIDETSCDTIGERNNDLQLYCDLSYTPQPQKLDGSSCDNDFECISDVCQDDVCRPGLDFGDTDTGIDPDDEDGGSGSTNTGSSGGDRDPEWRATAGFCLSNWTCTKYTACVAGKKTRTCTDINDCEEPYAKPAEQMLCAPLIVPTCNDGILNQGEEEPDCGGPCEACATCFDNIQNCHGQQCEDEIDCGGPCMPCKHALPLILAIITGILVIILIILGIWYFKIRKTGDLIAENIEQFTGEEITKPKEPLRI